MKGHADGVYLLWWCLRKQPQDMLAILIVLILLHYIVMFLHIPSRPPVLPLAWTGKGPVPALTLQVASYPGVSSSSNLLSPLLGPGTGLGQQCF